jgi:hypothetical protein
MLPHESQSRQPYVFLRASDLRNRFLLHRASGPYLTPFKAHANITIQCARYLQTCTDFATNDPLPVVWGRTIKGFHDIFPYVHEYWPEHLTKCMDSKSTWNDSIWEAVFEQMDCLASMFNRQNACSIVEDCQHATATLSRSTSARKPPSLPQIVQDYLDFRRSISMRTRTTRPECDNALVESDPTGLSETYANFRVLFESLMNNQLPFSSIDLKINPSDFEQFIQRHRSAAYCCSWSGCDYASIGFQSATLRADHENFHKKQYRCTDPACDFANNGFPSRGALRKHILKYHTNEEDLILPKFLPFRKKVIKARDPVANTLPNAPVALLDNGNEDGMQIATPSMRTILVDATPLVEELHESITQSQQKTRERVSVVHKKELSVEVRHQQRPIRNVS